MKHFICAVALCLSAALQGQFVFEEVNMPADFSLVNVRKSQTGEYFTQAFNDVAGIYTSTDGANWTRSAFPGNGMKLENIQFFSDGTPMLMGEFGESMVRREGVWHNVSVSAPMDLASATWISGDTLFAYREQVFAYSLDKGENFVPLFTASESIEEHRAHVWVYGSHVILHHRGGVSSRISVFNRQGQRVLLVQTISSPRDFLFRACGEILLYNSSQYWLMDLTTLNIMEGNVQDLHPGFESVRHLQVLDDRFYFADGASIYRTGECDMDWELWVSGTQLDSFPICHVEPLGGVLIYSDMGDRFYEIPDDTSLWTLNLIQLDIPYWLRVREADPSYQLAATPNALFTSSDGGMEWTEQTFFPMVEREFHYAPNGTMYVTGEFDLYRSADNGVSFDTLPLPAFQFHHIYYDLHVLSDEVLFIIDELGYTAYYSLDAGETWVSVFYPISTLPEYQVRLAGNFIMVVEHSISPQILRINVGTQQVSHSGIGSGEHIEVYDMEIMEDGTILYAASYDFGNGDSGLFRHRFGQAPDHLGFSSVFNQTQELVSSRHLLYSFRTQSVAVYDNGELVSLTIQGLPDTGKRRYIVSANHYLYVIVDDTRIFRSVEPLSYAQNLTGRIVVDDDHDCLSDTLDAGLRGWQVSVEGGAYPRVRPTRADGTYNFSLPAGDYTVTATPISSHWSLCTSSQAVTVEVGEQIQVPDFPALAQSSCADLMIDFSTPRLRRCFDNTYSIRVRNTGPEASAGTQLRLELDPFFDIISATHPFTMESDSVLLFDLGVLSLNADIQLQMVFNLSCSADAGITHCLSGRLVDDNLCGSERSVNTECQQNIGSFDPNDKRSFNSAGRETQTLDKGEFVYYHIRFQNTGTDTAFRVRLLDTLSDILDPRTLEVLSASHSHTYAVIDGPALEVIFDDIFLPDSSVDESASQGYVKFRIKPYPQYDYGTMIPNEAAIYFDFNDPVLTEEAVIILQRLVSTQDPQALVQFGMYPNPTTETLHLQLAPEDRNRVDGYRIVDGIGRSMNISQMTSGMRIPVAGVLPGVNYLELLYDGKVVGRKRFVKM